MRFIFAIALMLLFWTAYAPKGRAEADESQRYRACLAKAYSNPTEAYEDALIWKNEGGASPARHCLAMAFLGMNAFAEGAEQLEALAYAPDIESQALKTEVLIQSGEAWLQAERPKDALRVLDLALERQKNNADVYTNRARAEMALGNVTAAHADLDQAIRLRPDHALALRLRAAVQLREGKLQAAQSDIEAALRFEPSNVDALLVRGQIREARRLR